VAANSLAAASAGGDSRIASVVVHASCYGALLAQPACLHPTSTYRLLELLQELVCLLFLGPVSCRLHHVVCRQHRLEALLRSVRGHVWGKLGTLVGEEEADGARRRRMAGHGLYGVHALEALFLGEGRLGGVCGLRQVPSRRVV
jgi:hypothetical protein